MTTFNPPWEGFYVYENPGGASFHILVVDGNGGYIFVEYIQSREEADWVAAALNTALAQKKPLPRQCGYCLNWFEAGVGTGRRADARYCSNEHQILFNSRKRSINHPRRIAVGL